MFWPRENWGESKKKKEGGGGEEKSTTCTKIRSSSKNTVLENPVISSGLLDSNMLSDFRYSDISLEDFFLTAFRTSGYNCECFVIVLAAACQFLSHICLTKHLVSLSRGILTRTFPELTLRTTFTWRPPWGRLSMFKNWSRLSIFSVSDIWRFSFPKFFVETSHCLFLSLEKRPELICISDFFPLACLANAYLLELTY